MRNKIKLNKRKENKTIKAICHIDFRNTERDERFCSRRDPESLGSQGITNVSTGYVPAAIEKKG